MCANCSARLTNSTGSSFVSAGALRTLSKVWSCLYQHAPGVQCVWPSTACARSRHRKSFADGCAETRKSARSGNFKVTAPAFTEQAHTGWSSSISNRCDQPADHAQELPARTRRRRRLRDHLRRTLSASRPVPGCADTRAPLRARSGSRRSKLAIYAVVVARLRHRVLDAFRRLLATRRR